MSSPRVQRALISVSDKTGVLELAKALIEKQVQIFSTGGTRKHLESAGIPVTDVANYTGFPEMLDGRVKTLHPKIFAGILCRRDHAEDMEIIAQHGVLSFELVVVNLYPFEATISKPNVAFEEAVEQVDIGGPSLVRASAKNHQFVTIATSSNQYGEIIRQIQESGCTTYDLRRQLMADAFAHTAKYDQVIAEYFRTDKASNALPPVIDLRLRQVDTLRYGENPHQNAALYEVVGSKGTSLVHAEKLNGKELSYNNLLDLDSALTIARSLPDSAVSVIKHNNPCGAASAKSVSEACRKAMEGDPLSAFGAVLGFNTKVDAATAEFLSGPNLFVEAIVAPDFDPEAIKILTTKPKWRENVRLMKVGPLTASQVFRQFRQIEGGMLLQDSDTEGDVESKWEVKTELTPSPELLDELRFAWRVCRHVKSNAIVVCNNRSLLGAGAGQMSRVDSVEIAIRKAGERVRGAVLASDAFFPFPDSIHRAAEAGIAAIIQPGGSKKDPDVIAACNQLKIPMIFTGRRHFKH